MKKILLQTLLLLVVFSTFAQNPALEFAAGDGNPTTNQANVFQNTSIRFRNNTNNPTGNTFATYNPALNVSFELSNQQYTQTNFTGYNGATFIGYPNEPQLIPINFFGADPPAGTFTSSGAPVGTGIDVAVNRIVNLFTNVQPLTTAGRATNGRWQMADLTITFNRPVDNPHLQINALGGNSNGRSYSAEFEILSSNVPVSFSKVSGTNQLNVTSTAILHSGVTPNGAKPNGSGRGTVLVTGDGITTIVLRVFMRGAAANTGTNWHGTANLAGDGYMIGFDLLESDLSVTKTVNTPTPNVGSNVVFTVTATNNGASNDTGVQVQDLLPSGYTYVSHTVSAGGGTYTPGTGLWNIGNLNNGISRTLNITATVNATGNYTNVATIGGTNGDPNLTNNNASVSTNPLVPFDCGDNRLFLNQAVVNTDPSILFDIERSSNPFVFSPIDNGSHGITYNAIGYNSQDNLIYGIRSTTNELVVIDATGVPVILGAVTGLPVTNYLSGDFDEDGFLYVHTTNLATADRIYKIDVATRTVVQTLTLPRNALFFDIAYNPVDGFLYTVLGAADSDPGRILRIDRNTGAIIAVGPTPSSVVIFGALFIDALGNFYGVANNGSGFYQFDLTTGQRTVISDAPSSSLNDGAVCASSILTFDADISVTKTDGNTSYTPGTNVVYTIVVTNDGPFGATNVTVSDPLIPGIPASNHSYTAAVADGATTSVSGTQTGAINDVVNLPAGATVTYTLTIAVPANFIGELTNTVTVTPPVNINDTNLSNNVATDTNIPVSDLSITKTVDNATPDVGQNVTFLITATNNGPSTDTNVTVEDILPSGYTFVSANPSSGTSWSAPIWTIGNLPNGTSATLEIVATVNVIGEHVNIANITGDNDDPNLSNNQASVSTTTICKAGDGQVPLIGTKINNQ